MIPVLDEAKGYTLVEIAVVTIVVSVLAGLAIPRATLLVERMRAEEGKELLLSLYSAQKRYALDHNGDYTDNIADLDIELRPSAHFPTVVVAKTPPTSPLASMTRAGSLYTLSISDQASISCSGTGGVCARLGF